MGNHFGIGKIKLVRATKASAILQASGELSIVGLISRKSKSCKVSGSSRNSG
jgi:hypothetical protein